MHSSKHPLLIKICGLSEPVTLETALQAGVDMVGFVHFKKSPRYVAMDAMAKLADQARGRAEIVVLTVNAPDDELAALDKAVRPDWWQFHGQEDAARIKAVRERFDRPILKAVGVASADDVALAERMGRVADGLLLDAKPPKDATRPGGLGAPFDWSLLDIFDPDLPFMLSGGLTADTVGEAVLRTGARGVDLSSALETAPGRKDPDLIKTFIAAARAVTPASRPDAPARTTA